MIIRLPVGDAEALARFLQELVCIPSPSTQEGALAARVAVNRFWQEVFGFFFPGGPTDPDYCLLKITPKKVEYLDPGLTVYQTRVRTIITV